MLTKGQAFACAIVAGMAWIAGYSMGNISGRSTCGDSVAAAYAETRNDCIERCVEAIGCLHCSGQFREGMADTICESDNVDAQACAKLREHGFDARHCCGAVPRETGKKAKKMRGSGSAGDGKP